MPYTIRPSQRDVKCPDGFTCYGWRRVNKGGYVRFAHGRHYHEELSGMVGQYVWVTLDDPWALHVNVHPDGALAGATPLSACNEREWLAEAPNYKSVSK